MKRNEITVTMTKKQLKSIVSLMGIALDTDCKAMNNLSNQQLNKILYLYAALQTMSKTIK
jgi:type IV secretory pathway VirB4 component